MTFAVSLVWLVSLFGAFWHGALFVTGETYDYVLRRRTYHGTKCLLYSIVLGVMYLVPWSHTGVFN